MLSKRLLGLTLIAAGSLALSSFADGRHQPGVVPLPPPPNFHRGPVPGPRPIQPFVPGNLQPHHQHIQVTAGSYHQTQVNLYQQRWNTYRVYDGNVRYQNHYRGLDRQGFYGGYYYPVRPCTNISLYFNYPIVYWLYVQQPYVPYFQTYYGQHYAQYPVRPFPYVGAFFPTETMQALAVDMSGRDPISQYNFRESLGIFANLVRDQIARSIGRPFNYGPYSIVVTHAVPAGASAVVIDGFVDSPLSPPGQPFRAFKAWVDLTNPNFTLAVAPAGPMLTPDQAASLTEINRRMTTFQLNPFMP